MTPKKALAAYVLTVIVFLLGVFSLYNNLEPQLKEVEKSIKQGNTLVLKKGIDPKLLSDKLYDGGYINSRDDANLIASRICNYLDTNLTLPNLGALMKADLKIKVDTTLGGDGLKSRIKGEYIKLGIANDLADQLKEKCRSPFKDSIADGLIRVTIKNGEDVTAELSNIPVRITRYAYDGTEVKDTILGYSMTNANGYVEFQVSKGGHYSVVPVREGFQYGREKGTTDGALSSPLDLSFVQKHHVLTLLDPQVFSNLKYDRTLVVRSPAEFKDSLVSMAATFILGWLVFLMFIFQLDKKLGTRSDYLLIIVLMILSGIGLLASFGIWNPLTDTLYGSTMTSGLLIGLVVMGLLVPVNYAKLDAKLTRSKWWILRNYGWVALAGAMGLLALLYAKGTGPEGSDAKVNLFGFQPSEISRILIVIFIAWFFARKATLIQDFSARLTTRTLKRQLATISWVILSILALLAIYMILSDMGPALVVAVTFILIYSMARRDFAQLLLGLLTFAVLMYAANWTGINTLIYVVALLWFVGWGIYWYMKKRQIYESAIFLNVVIFVFSFAGPLFRSIGQDGLANRLGNRTAMVGAGAWDNEAPGGDQVVQGIWSMATGRFSGLGLGNGSPAIVPAGHTDMIFTTIGEMLGLVGLALVVLCFFVLIHRTLLDGRRAGYTFPFYLATGLGIVTGIQFIIIVGGSIGLLPLTGVTLPFLSYGRVSFILSLVSFGVVISISRLRANEVQKEYTNSFNGSIAACSGLFLLGSVVLLATSAKYQIFTRGTTLIRPAFVNNMNGARIVEYNPRINLVLRKLEAGNIYDRNGLLLATSSRAELDSARTKLIGAGVTDEMFNNEHNKRKRRYYPFQAHTLFMLGDFNTLKVFGYYNDNPIGYLAESRHLNQLRGIDIKSDIKNDNRKYKANRFVDSIAMDFKLQEYDYSNLLNAGFLDYGIERNPVIEAHNAKRAKRDIVLSIDARLQTLLQNEIADALSKDPNLKKSNLLRASVVVLDAKRGDLLASANYPLPDQDAIHMLNKEKIYGDVPFEKIVGQAPITERDLGLTFQSHPGSTAKVMSAMAGLMKLGPEAANITYKVYDEEKIEDEEPFADGKHDITMLEAIRESSNNYFINLVAANELYSQLDSIYSHVGVRVNPASELIPGIDEKNRNIVPYFFYRDKEFKKRHEFDNLMTALGHTAVSTYKDYMPKREQKEYKRMIWGATQPAWGQGPIHASPLNMARVASIVANGGKLVPTRYTLKIGNDSVEPNKPVTIISEQSANKLKSFMQEESKKHKGKESGYAKRLPIDAANPMGGKTGTPERPVPEDLRKGVYANSRSGRANDAWYIFFIQSETLEAPLAVAVRLERTAAKGLGSWKAVQLVANVIIPKLNEAGYRVM